MGCVPGSHKTAMFQPAQSSQQNIIRSSSAGKFTGYYGSVPREVDISVVGSSASIPYPDQAYPYNNTVYLKTSNASQLPNVSHHYGLGYNSMFSPSMEAYGLSPPSIIQQGRQSIVTPRTSAVQPRASAQRLSITPQRSMKRTSSFTTYGNFPFPQLAVSPPPIQAPYKPKVQPQVHSNSTKRISIDDNMRGESCNNIVNMSKASSIDSKDSRASRGSVKGKQILPLGSHKHVSFASIQYKDPKQALYIHATSPPTPNIFPSNLRENLANMTMNTVMTPTFFPHKHPSLQKINLNFQEEVNKQNNDYQYGSKVKSGYYYNT